MDHRKKTVATKFRKIVLLDGVINTGFIDNPELDSFKLD